MQDHRRVYVMIAFNIISCICRGIYGILTYIIFRLIAYFENHTFLLSCSVSCYMFRLSLAIFRKTINVRNSYFDVGKNHRQMYAVNHNIILVKIFVNIIRIKARLHGSPRLINTVESTKVNRVNSFFQRK